MKQRKIWMCVLVGAMVCGIASGQLKEQQKEIEDEIGIVLPMERWYDYNVDNILAHISPFQIHNGFLILIYNICI